MDNSMNEAGRFVVQREKLNGICEKNGLSYVFIKNTYPIKLYIRPLGGMGEQLSMLEESSEDTYISPNASIMFTVKDGKLTYRMSDTFTISDALFNKIKNIFKSMHYLWLQYFFRELVESGTLKMMGARMPDIPEDANGKNADTEPSQEKSEPDTPEAKVLALIGQNGVTQAYVADKLKIDSNDAFELLDTLEGKDLIDFCDGRYYLHKTEE